MRWLITIGLAVGIAAAAALLLFQSKPTLPPVSTVTLPIAPAPAQSPPPASAPPQQPPTAPSPASESRRPDPLALPGGGFSLPIECRIGDNCWVLNYFDVDSGPDASDFRCRPRSYEGHNGVDFAIRDLKAMAAGVSVTASADGTVRAIREGEADGLFLEKGKDATQNRECGNGVLIEHGGGWQTQYCHMRSGSVSVKAGAKVARGDRLGMVGLSGNTEWPHVHIVIRKDGIPLDPFTGKPAEAGCTPDQRTGSLWNVATRIDYEQFHISGVGFLSRTTVSERDFMRDGSGETELRADSDAVVLWVVIFGANTGDLVRFKLQASSGAVLAETSQTMDRPTAFRVPSMILRRTGQTDWPRGRYRGIVTVERSTDGGRVLSQTREATVDIR